MKNCVKRLLFGTFVLALTVVAVADQPVVRTWTDASGKFKVEAKLLHHDETSIKLLKNDDRVVELPIAKLSEADVKFLKELAAKEAEADNPFAGGELMAKPEMSADPTPASTADFSNAGDVIELKTNGLQISLAIDENMSPLPADAPATQPKFVEFSRMLEGLDAYARISPPVLIDPTVPLYAVSTHRNGNRSDPATFGRLYLVKEQSRHPQVAAELEETLVLLDHDIATDRSLVMLGVNYPSDRGGDLVLLEGVSSDKPKLIDRWHLPEWQKPGFKPKVEYGALVDGERAVVRIDRKLYCWSLEDGSVSFVIDGVSSRPQLSANGKYLAIPVGHGCQIIDVARKELVGKIPFPSSLTPEVHFSPDGTRLALAAGDFYVIWNFENAGIEQSETTDKTTGYFIGWVGDHHILTQFSLIDLEVGRRVWEYYLPDARNAIGVTGGVVMSTKNRQPSMLSSLPIPHPPVASATKDLEKQSDEMYALSPGSKVAIKVESVESVDEKEIEAALKVAIEKAGWKVDKSSDVQLIAEISRGEKQKLNFRNIGSSIFGPFETVTLKPFRASVKIQQGQKTLWTRSSQNMVPPLIRLQNGESLKAAVKRFEKADPGFFERMALPPKVFKPEFQNQIGRTSIKNGRWQDR